eukprot:15465638-Alexandrium_andersonii.AAC.1
MHELQRELWRVEVQSEVAQAHLAERARQEVTLVQNVFACAEGHHEEAQSRAQVFEQRLDVAAVLLADNEELR